MPRSGDNFPKGSWGHLACDFLSVFERLKQELHLHAYSQVSTEDREAIYVEWKKHEFISNELTKNQFG